MNIRSRFILSHFSARGTASKRVNLVTLKIQMCTELEASKETLPGSEIVENDGTLLMVHQGESSGIPVSPPP